MRDGICNAIVESAVIDDADRGMLTAWLHLDYGGNGQGFGGYALYLPDTYKNGSARWNYAGIFIWRCMEIAGVSDWSRIRGKAIRVRVEDGLAVAIGHIVKDDWFCPREEFRKLQSSEPTDAD